MQNFANILRNQLFIKLQSCIKMALKKGTSWARYNSNRHRLAWTSPVVGVEEYKFCHLSGYWPYSVHKSHNLPISDKTSWLKCIKLSSKQPAKHVLAQKNFVDSIEYVFFPVKACCQTTTVKRKLETVSLSRLVKSTSMLRGICSSFG